MNVKSSISHQLTTRFEEALVYATRLHANQTRKTTGVPYICHLLSVAALVIEDGGNEDEAIAALLHDAIEDQGGDKTRVCIREKFGEEVARIVEGCTESDTIPKPPWKERKLVAIEKMRHADSQIRRVMLADKLHNARSLLADLHHYGDEIWKFFKGGKELTLWFYRSIIEANQEVERGFLLQELNRVIQQLEDLDQTENTN